MNSENAQAVLPQSVGYIPYRTSVQRGYDRVLYAKISVVETWQADKIILVVHELVPSLPTTT